MTKEIPIDQLVAEMGELIAAITKTETKNNIVPRFNQPKTVAYLDAEFRVHDNIPVEFKQGIFSKPASYTAKIRFANATNKDDSKKDIRGISIRLANVDGSVLWGKPGFSGLYFKRPPRAFCCQAGRFFGVYQG